MRTFKYFTENGFPLTIITEGAEAETQKWKLNLNQIEMAKTSTSKPDNGPSTNLGKPSGKGRGNNPPKPKK